MHIELHDGRCVGAGQCVLNAPALFDQTDDGLVQVLNADPADGEVEAARQAVELCPSGALEVSAD